MPVSILQIASAVLLALMVLAIGHFGGGGDGLITYCISVAIAVIPESLVAVVTITMAKGMKNMARNKAVVRQLASIETIGSITNICSDKTGTLTKAKMVLTKFWTSVEGFYSVTGLGYNPEGQVFLDGHEEDASEQVEVNVKDINEQLIKCASLCNTAEIKQDIHTGEWIGMGAPTENALQTFAQKLKMGRNVLTDAEGPYQLELIADSSVLFSWLLDLCVNYLNILNIELGITLSCI